MKILILLLNLLAGCFLTGCTLYDFSRPVVQQGNLLPAELVNRLRVGMSKEDVAILLGSSLLNATFMDDRVDYAYTLRVHGNLVEKHSVTLFFRHNTLVAIQKH